MLNKKEVYKQKIYLNVIFISRRFFIGIKFRNNSILVEKLRVIYPKYF